MQNHVSEELQPLIKLFEGRSIEQLAEAVFEATSVSLEDLRSKHRSQHILEAKWAFAYWGKFGLGISFQEINQFLGKNQNWAGSATQDAIRHLEINAGFQNLLRKVAERLPV